METVASWHGEVNYKRYQSLGVVGRLVELGSHDSQLPPRADPRARATVLSPFLSPTLFFLLFLYLKLSLPFSPPLSSLHPLHTNARAHTGATRTRGRACTLTRTLTRALSPASIGN